MRWCWRTIGTVCDDIFINRILLLPTLLAEIILIRQYERYPLMQHHFQGSCQKSRYTHIQLLSWSFKPGFHITKSARDSIPDSAGAITGACTVDMPQTLQTNVSFHLPVVPASDLAIPLGSYNHVIYRVQ